jgi:hypothetical protein
VAYQKFVERKNNEQAVLRKIHESSMEKHRQDEEEQLEKHFK